MLLYSIDDTIRYTDKKKLIGEQATLLLQASGALEEERKTIKKSTGKTTKKERKLRSTENEFKKVIISSPHDKTMIYVQCLISLRVRTCCFWSHSGNDWKPRINMVAETLWLTFSSFSWALLGNNHHDLPFVTMVYLLLVLS